jgi:hypothetical protein
MVLNTMYSVVYCQQFGQVINADIKNVNMNTVNTSNINTIYNGITGQVLVHTGNGLTNWSDSISIDKSLIEYIDLLYQIMGIDITYDKWKNMSDGERLQLIRDIKLKKIIEE